MSTFFKTFFICLFIALGFIAYKFVSEDSYNSNLSISKNNPIFTSRDFQKDNKGLNEKVNSYENTPPAHLENNEETQKPQEKKYTYYSYFYDAKGNLVSFERQLAQPTTLQNAIQLLLKGPTIAETRKGIHTEIPIGVDLISVKNTDKSVIVDLTSNFGKGGGSESIENRVKQLSRTVKRITPSKNVYLYINGKEVEYLGGDGVFIKQPLD